MEISKDAALIQAYRRGDASRIPGPMSPLGQVCSQCGNRVAVTDPAVLANDALGWQIAHPHCVGASVEPSAVIPAEPIEIDYGKGKAPYRAALVAEAKAQDAAIGMPGYTLRAIARAHLSRAIESDQSARDIADRLDGKPQQSVDIMSVNINATARDLTEAELDEILAKVAEKSVRKLDAGQKSITIDQK